MSILPKLEKQSPKNNIKSLPKSSPKILKSNNVIAPNYNKIETAYPPGQPSIEKESVANWADDTPWENPKYWSNE